MVPFLLLFFFSRKMVPLLLLFFFAMAYADQIALDGYPMFRIYKDGHVDRLTGNEIIPASLDPKTNVQSKDIQYYPRYNLSVRLYLPKNTSHDQKLPLLVFFHGGGFVIQSPFSNVYHEHLNSLVNKANIAAVSVQYRRAPEDPLPCAHDDSWTALKWVASHVDRSGPADWLNCHVDFQRVFLYGDSAGANIAHNMGMRHGLEKLEGINVAGIILGHPFFWSNEPLEAEKNNINLTEWHDKLLHLIYPSASGFDIPLINPEADPNLAKLGCTKLLDFVAGKDFLRHRGRHFYDVLTKSGWKGNAKIVDNRGEDHVVFLGNSTRKNVVAFLKKIASFVNDV